MTTPTIGFDRKGDPTFVRLLSVLHGRMVEVDHADGTNTGTISTTNGGTLVLSDIEGGAVFRVAVEHIYTVTVLG